MQLEEEKNIFHSFQELKNSETQLSETLNAYEIIYKDFYLKMKKNKNSLLKVSQYDNIFDKNVIIEDIFSDRKESQNIINQQIILDDDQIFLENELLLTNLRRGNTMLRINDENFKLIEKKIIRKGLPKFFLLQPEFVDQSQQTWVSRNQQYKQMKNAMFKEIEKSLSNGNQIKIFKLEKVNGKNAQISYNKEFDIWCIASKNMSIILKKKEDIQQYLHKNELSIVLDISLYWFELLEKLTEQQLIELKQLLDQCTLMGEFCKKDSQHLVNYSETIIKFFAIVLNYSDKPCIDPLLTKYFLTYFNFPQVNYEEIGVFENYEEFEALLLKLQQNISKRSLQEDGEGVVLYFAEKKKNYSSYQVLNLCKIKSLEYRIFRQLRERVQRAKQETQPLKLIKSFEKDLNGLFKTQFAFKSQKYYEMFGQYLIEQHQKFYQRVKEMKFFEFLKLCQQKFQIIENKKDFKLELVDDIFEEEKNQEDMEEFKIDQKETNFEHFPRIRIVIITLDFYLYPTEQYYLYLKDQFKLTQILTRWSQNEQIANIFQIRHINYIPQLDIKKLDDLNLRTFFLIIGLNENNVEKIVLNFKENQFENDKVNKNKQQKEIKKFQNQQLNLIKESNKLVKTLQQYLPNNYKILDNINSSKEQKAEQTLVDEIKEIFKIFPLKIEQKQQQQEEIKKIFVFVPVGIPAMGKSFQIRILTQLLEQSDFNEFEIISSDEIRRQCMEQLRKKNPSHSLMSEDELYNKTTKPAKDQFEKQLIAALKNINSNKKIIILDKNHLPNNIPQTIKLIQKSINVGYSLQIIALLPLQTKKLKNYPFSLQFYFTCLQRSIKRENHLTLVGSAFKMTSVLTMFLKQFYNQEFNQEFCKQFGFDGSIFLSYHVEDENLQFDRNLVDQFFAMLKIKKLEENSAQLTEFIQNFIKQDFEPKNVSSENIKEYFFTELQKLGIQFVEKKQEEQMQVEKQLEEEQKIQEEELKIN